MKAMSYKEAKRFVREHRQTLHGAEAGRFTLVCVRLGVGVISPPIFGSGVALRHPNDTPDSDLGVAIARGRAEADAARQLLRRLEKGEPCPE